MDNNDRQAIDGLFSRIAEVERQSGQLDPEANAFIGQKIAAQPAAPYLMAQTIVVQDQALAAAEERIQELERQAAAQPASRSSGGLLSSLFGGGAAAASTSAPARRAAPAYGQPQQAPQASTSPWGQQGTGPAGYGQQAGRGGGFLQGAAQTAMGVAGGMLLGSAIGSMFAGNEANAAENPADDASNEDMAGEDIGGEDMGDMDF
jgi:hypothetical protein